MPTVHDSHISIVSPSTVKDEKAKPSVISYRRLFSVRGVTMTRVVVIEVIPAKFPPGQIVMTPGAVEAFATNEQQPMDFIRRHLMGDWGEVDDQDRAANDWALISERRILSAYSLKDGTKFWIISEADRSSSCILLPEEY